MTLNDGFDKKYEAIINLYLPLAEWFENNQNTMAEYGFTNKNCLKYVKKNLNIDIIVLGMMASAAFNWLDISPDVSLSPHARAFNAAMAIHKIYLDQKDVLSDKAKISYNINNKKLKNSHAIILKK